MRNWKQQIQAEYAKAAMVTQSAHIHTHTESNDKLKEQLDAVFPIWTF